MPPPPPEVAAAGPPVAQSTDGQATIISRNLPQPTPLALTEPLSGRQLAHFQLLEAVGVGGMAAVIKARDLQLDRCVALKVLPPEMAKDPDAVQRFHQEARAAARLDHENIARVFYCGQDQSLHFIAFEYVEGENLRTILDRRGRLPVPEAVHYMLQVATGLAHAAARGVVHRDIKPSNIIITPTGRAKLVDMGLARHLEQPFDKGLTHSGVTLGTFDYISPEQAEEPRNADVRSDIYSLGCTFYHVLTGQPPVPEGTAAKKLMHHSSVAPIDPRQLNPDIPDDVTAVLARMMAKDPKDRYQRAEQLVHHLILIAQRVGASADLPEGPLYVDASLPQPPQARPLLIAAIATLALILLVVIIGQLSRTATPPNFTTLIADGRGSGSVDADATTPVDRSSKTSGDSSVKEVVTPKQPLVFNNKEPTARALATFLREARSDADVQVDLPGGDLDVSDLPTDAGRSLLVFHGHKLLIQSRDPANPCVIRLSDTSATPPERLLAALEADCDELVLKNLRFIVTTESADTALASLAIRCGKKCQIDQCQFLVAQPSPAEKSRSAAIMVAGRKDNVRPAITLQGCSFISAESYLPGTTGEDAVISGVDRGTSDAILFQGACKAELSQCAFGPHYALVHADGKFAGDLVVRCTNCTGLLTGGSAFLLDDGTVAELSLRQNLIGRAGPDVPETDEHQPVLLREPAQSSEVVFKGEGNCYYHLDFSRLRQGALDSDASTTLKKSPWKYDNPLKLLERPARIRDAFQLDDLRADLRQKDLPLKLVGIDHVPGGQSYNTGLGLVAERKPLRIVDPTVSQTSNGVYQSLSTALREARPGDQIKIRCKAANVLKESSITLDRPDLDVVISPDEGCDPVLMLDESSLELDPALFRIQKGKIQFEHIEFVLQPRGDGTSMSQALFAMLGDGHLDFKDCVFTLDPSQRNVSLAILRLEDMAKDVKPLTKPDHRPFVRFDDCLLRANGDVVRARGAVCLDLQFAASLVAVSGSLLNVENTSQALSGVHLKMDKVTVCLGGNLLHVLQQGKEVRSPIPLHGDAINDCLFIAARGSPLIHLDGLAAGDERMKKLFAWDGRNNAYANFSQLLKQTTNDDSMAMLYCEPADWEKIYEPNARFLKAASDTLASFLPPQVKFKPKSDWQGFGISDMDTLPRPHWPLDKAKPEED